VPSTSIMPLCERLVRAAESAAKLANARRVRLGAQVLLVAAVAFVILRLRSIWHDSHVDLAQVDWLVLAGAFVISLGALVASAFIWLAILAGLGTRIRPRWVGIFFQAQLAKYVPGTIWQYAGRTAYAADQGISARTCASSIAVELASSALAAATMAFLLLGWLGCLAAAALLLAAVALRLAASRRSFARKSWLRAGIRAWFLYLPVWALLGLGFWLCVRAFTTTSADDIPLFAAAFAVAWLVGLVAVYAPGGIGVREAVLVALLAGRIGTAEALLAATASRGILTLCDFALGASGAWLMRRPGDSPPLHNSLAATRERRAGTSA
jgi:glycosyltransferase 2 family protein